MGSKDTKEKEIKQLTVPVKIGSDHIKGSINAPINLVEYGDYECPYTAAAYPIVKEIMSQFADKIYFVFRNFPLNDIHSHAQGAAEAAEAAAAQDKFWDMHDYLFEHQKALDYTNLLEYAQEVGLDIERFKKDMSRHAYASLIEQSLKGGINSGVEGTLTFFINGVRYEDSWDLDTLSETFQNYLAHRRRFSRYGDGTVPSYRMVWPEKALGALATEAIRYNGDALKINKNIQTSNLLSIRNW